MESLKNGKCVLESPWNIFEFFVEKGYEPCVQFKGAGGVLPLLCELDSSLSQGQTPSITLYSRYVLVYLTLSLPKVAKVSFSKMLENKWYHVKVLPQRFHLNGHTRIFCTDSKVRTILADSITPSGSAKWWGTVSSNALVQAKPLWRNAVAQSRLPSRTWQTESVEGVLCYLPCLMVFCVWIFAWQAI